MQLAELEQIEQALGIVLPDDYKTVMQNYPFARYPEAREGELYDDVHTLIGVNKEVREKGHHGTFLRPHEYIIGVKYCAYPLYLDLNLSRSPVYVINDEGVVIDEYCFSDWIEIQLEEFAHEQEEMEKEQELRKNKKWWQFWI
jgi:hypothetical protein